MNVAHARLASHTSSGVPDWARHPRDDAQAVAEPELSRSRSGGRADSEPDGRCPAEFGHAGERTGKREGRRADEFAAMGHTRGVSSPPPTSANHSPAGPPAPPFRDVRRPGPRRHRGLSRAGRGGGDAGLEVDRRDAGSRGTGIHAARVGIDRPVGVTGAPVHAVRDVDAHAYTGQATGSSSRTMRRRARSLQPPATSCAAHGLAVDSDLCQQRQRANRQSHGSGRRIASIARHARSRSMSTAWRRRSASHPSRTTRNARTGDVSSPASASSIAGYQGGRSKPVTAESPDQNDPDTVWNQQITLTCGDDNPQPSSSPSTPDTNPPGGSPSPSAGP